MAGQHPDCGILRGTLASNSHGFLYMLDMVKSLMVSKSLLTFAHSPVHQHPTIHFWETKIFNPSEAKPWAAYMDLCLVFHGTSSPPAAAREGLQEESGFGGRRVITRDCDGVKEGEVICTNRFMAQQSLCWKPSNLPGWPIYTNQLIPQGFKVQRN